MPDIREKLYHSPLTLSRIFGGLKFKIRLLLQPTGRLVKMWFDPDFGPPHMVIRWHQSTLPTLILSNFLIQENRRMNRVGGDRVTATICTGRASMITQYRLLFEKIEAWKTLRYYQSVWVRLSMVSATNFKSNGGPRFEEHNSYKRSDP